jgi:uncharacterized protein with von Willebrand factor type A (vWA) domain
MTIELETVELDLPRWTARFGRRLSEVGVPVTPDRAARFADALALVRPVARTRLYWTARAALVTDASQVRAFDSIFFEVFGLRVDADAAVNPALHRDAPAPPEPRREDARPDDPRRGDAGGEPTPASARAA